MNLEQKLTASDEYQSPKATIKMPLLTLQILFDGLASTTGRCLLGFFGLLGSVLTILSVKLNTYES